jgi:hypothetical protein
LVADRDETNDRFKWKEDSRPNGRFNTSSIVVTHLDGSKKKIVTRKL